MLYLYATIAIALIILILSIPYLYIGPNKDTFYTVPSPLDYQDYQDQNGPFSYYYNQYDPSYDTHTEFAFWNTQRGTRRGMSYDLRGDAGAPIPNRQVFPFNMSTMTPIVNKPLEAVY